MVLAETAEKTLVGSMVLATDKIIHVAEVVKPEDFINPDARKAFISIMSLWRKRQNIDIVSVCDPNLGIAKYVAEATSLGSGIGIRDEARQVARIAKARRVKEGLENVLKSNDSIESRLEDILSVYQREVVIESKPSGIGDVIKRFNQQQEENRRLKRLGFPTGFQFLEDSHIQYVPGHIWVMGAYTSVGKTAMMVQKLCNLLPLDRCPKIIVVSTEMTEEQLVSRILGNFTGVHPFRILSGNYRHGEEEFVEEMKSMIKDKPLMIIDDIYDVSLIETVFRKAELQGGVDMGFIDYVQNCRCPGASSSYQEQADMAKRFQRMAKDARCCLVCLSQVSNDVGRGNTDQLEFKGAGEWSAVADVGVHLQRSKTDKFALKYLVKKNRHGRLLEQMFEYKMDYTRLEVV